MSHLFYSAENKDLKLEPKKITNWQSQFNLVAPSFYESLIVSKYVEQLKSKLTKYHLDYQNPLKDSEILKFFDCSAILAVQQQHLKQFSFNTWKKKIAPFPVFLQEKYDNFSEKLLLNGINYSKAVTFTHASPNVDNVYCYSKRWNCLIELINVQEDNESIIFQDYRFIIGFNEFKFIKAWLFLESEEDSSVNQSFFPKNVICRTFYFEFQTESLLEKWGFKFSAIQDLKLDWRIQFPDGWQRVKSNNFTNSYYIIDQNELCKGMIYNNKNISYFEIFSQFALPFQLNKQGDVYYTIGFDLKNSKIIEFTFNKPLSLTLFERMEKVFEKIPFNQINFKTLQERLLEKLLINQLNIQNLE